MLPADDPLKDETCWVTCSVNKVVIW